MACTRAGGSEDVDVGQTEEGQGDTWGKVHGYHVMVQRYLSQGEGEAGGVVEVVPLASQKSGFTFFS